MSATDKVNSESVGLSDVWGWSVRESLNGQGQHNRMEAHMSVYKVVEIVGTSSSSWQDAALAAVNTAKETLRDLRVAEVVKQDLELGGDEVLYRTKLSISFKYQAD